MFFHKKITITVFLFFILSSNSITSASSCGWVNKSESWNGEVYNYLLLSADSDTDKTFKKVYSRYICEKKKECGDHEFSLIIEKDGLTLFIVCENINSTSAIKKIIKKRKEIFSFMLKQKIRKVIFGISVCARSNINTNNPKNTGTLTDKKIKNDNSIIITVNKPGKNFSPLKILENI